MRKERVQLQHVDQFDIDEVHLMWNTKPNQLRIEPSRKRKLNLVKNQISCCKE